MRFIVPWSLTRWLFGATCGGKTETEFVRRGFAAELAIGVAATCVFAAVGATVFLFGQRAFGEALLAVAPWLTLLNLQDYWRWIGFMQATPRKSLMNDLVFNAVQAIAFLVVFFVRSTLGVCDRGGVGLGGRGGLPLWP